MEDITSLEELQLDEVKNEGGLTSPDRVEKFRQTVKAMSTQVTPQTSPLGKVTVDLSLLGFCAGGLCIFKRIVVVYRSIIDIFVVKNLTTISFNTDKLYLI